MLNWGIIGPGLIAGHFAAAIARCDSSRLLAVASRDPSRGDLNRRFPGASVLSGYDTLLQDDDVDIVYIATPHPMHAEWAIRAAEAGKHVLCEKPIGMSAAEAEAIFAAARRAGTFMAEAFMYRLHPLTAMLVDVLEKRIVGDVRFIESSMAFDQPRDDAHRRLFAKELGGGGIFDIGVYPLSMARLIAGVQSGAPFENPVDVKGVAFIGDTGVDEWAAGVLQFPNGIIAEIACGISIELDNVLRIHGTLGRLEISDFWFGGGFDGGTAYINVIPRDGERHAIAVGDEGRGLYEFEIDAAARAIADGLQAFDAPGMTWQDTIGNMHAIDRWRESIGFPIANSKR